MVSISAAQVITPGGVLAPGVVDFDDGHIVAVRAARGSTDVAVLAPGFVDLQCNGFDDVDVAGATGPDWDRLGEMLVAQGVVAWCPTVVTRPLDSYHAVLAEIATAMAGDRARRPAMLGVHLEGPFLGGAPGAHPTELIRPIDRAWLDALPGHVRVITLAPEQPGANAVVRALTARGIVVALGHSTAGYDEAIAAVDAGARLVTHCFNGMGPFHHRNPGLAGAALTDDRVAISVIADLHHVHPAALRLAFLAKPRGQVIIVSDAVAWRGRGAGAVALQVGDGAARDATGRLAGTVVGLGDAVRNAVRAAGVTLEDAVFAAATAPADLVGATDHGRIVPGARADLVALDDDLRVSRTWIAGDVVFG